MTASATLRSGKGAHDENFPVASWLIKARYRPVIHAFYEFVRVADDIADHPTLPRDEKLARLDRLEAGLLHGEGGEPQGETLHPLLRRYGLSTQHAQDLLDAFRQDVTKSRYESWGELIDYCSRSAMPVGRFVLDVHGESRTTWPANDALCAALQIINHLQDCASDYRKLDRVYVPLDALAAHGIGIEALAAGHASPPLRTCLNALAERTALLLQRSEGFDADVSDTRLSLEISVIRSLAERLLSLLRTRDPLSERVHLSKAEMAAVGAIACARVLPRRLLRRRPAADHVETRR
jgi:squalene synthase HpnC